MLSGRCHCGAIQFSLAAKVVASSICHCRDCRRQSGAPISAWAMVNADDVAVSGEPKVYASSEDGRRSFCRDCGTSLFFTNAILSTMGMMQVRSATLEEPDKVAPQSQVQTAERIGWMATAHALPAFERFPV